MTLKEFYEAAGGDYADASCRLPSDALILKFLKMVRADESFPQLSAAFQAGDVRGAFRAAHTLKGVSLNLGLSSLAEVSSTLTEALRNAEAMPADADTLYAAVQREYTRVMQALDTLEG